MSLGGGGSSSSSLLPSSRCFVLPAGARRAANNWLCAFVNAIFPDDCRVCGEPLRDVSRVPVCRRCLEDHAPLTAEYYCIACRMPFLNRYPLDEQGRCALCRLGVSGFDAVYSYGSYDGALRKLIHLFKYNGVRPLLVAFRRTAGDRAAARGALRPDRSHAVALAAAIQRAAITSPALLAHEIARRWNAPVRNVVRRGRATRPRPG